MMAWAGIITLEDKPFIQEWLVVSLFSTIEETEARLFFEFSLSFSKYRPGFLIINHFSDGQEIYIFQCGSLVKYFHTKHYFAATLRCFQTIA